MFNAQINAELFMLPRNVLKHTTASLINAKTSVWPDFFYMMHYLTFQIYSHAFSLKPHESNITVVAA